MRERPTVNEKGIVVTNVSPSWTEQITVTPPTWQKSAGFGVGTGEGVGCGVAVGFGVEVGVAVPVGVGVGVGRR
jgi:hypothetical protein